MKGIKPVTLITALSSLAFCNMIYQDVFHILSMDGHNHSEYSIIWAPNAYMVFFLCAFERYISRWVMSITVFMTVIGFNFIYFSSQNYPIGMGTYWSSLLMYAVNNCVFIFGFFFLLRFWNKKPLINNGNEVGSFLILHVGGAICTLLSSLSVFIFPHASIVLAYQFFAANIMAFIFFSSYLFLSEKLINDDMNLKMMSFSFLVALSSLVFYVVNNFFHELSKESFSIILMGAFVCLFIKSRPYVMILIASLVSALFAAVNVALDLSSYEFILFYFVCISISVILIMRKQEIVFLESLKASLSQLEKSRLIDPLTNLLNREGFNKAIATVYDNQQEFIVGYADLDRFKDINDIFGHEAGDHVLKVIALRIKEILGNSSSIARLGGDEFSFIIIGSKEHAFNICEILIDEIKKTILLEDEDVSVDISVGLCCFPSQCMNIEDLLNRADMAMYSAKRSYARSPVFFRDEMDHRKTQELFNYQRVYKIENILNECYAVFQPIHSIGSCEIKSYEALLRHPTLPTVDIIKWAEEYGYMQELFEAMVMFSVRMILNSGLPVAVNLSPSQLVFGGERLLSFLKRVILEFNLKSYQLNVEITESIPIIEQEKFITIASSIKSLKIKLSLDDFGTGYSFFSTLSLGTFDAIKIDRNLVSGIHNSLPTQRLLTSIISYASSSNMTIIAEGVEVIEELETLKKIGVNFIQGFFYSKPMCESDALEYQLNQRGGSNQPQMAATKFSRNIKSVDSMLPKS